MAKKKLKNNKWLKYKVALVLCCLLSFSYLLWYSYYTHIDNVEEEDLPLVKAPSNIISKPQDPGGMIVPNKDKDIYNHMSGKKNKNDRVKATGLNKNNLSKSEALALINKQLKNREIKRKNISATAAVNKQIIPKSFKKTYYLRVAKLTNANVKTKALKILQNKYPNLKSFSGKLYEEKGRDGQKKYYLHIGPIREKMSAENLCIKLIDAGKHCKVFLEKQIQS